VLNCIIRLQAVVEITSNETTRTLNLLTNKALRCTIPSYQNRLALDYLLASEEKVCKKKN
jgi:hypothetical protein